MSKQKGGQLTTYSVDYTDNARYFQQEHCFSPTADEKLIRMIE
jgi:hypothetical protein